PLEVSTVNCYGRKVNSHKGGLSKFGQMPAAEQMDPPSPTPGRCFDMGAATARILAASPYRVALIASSSWSHAFLHDKGWHVFPDELVLLGGAMAELKRKPAWTDWVESYLFNSNKCFAIFP